MGIKQRKGVATLPIVVMIAIFTVFIGQTANALTLESVETGEKIGKTEKIAGIDAYGTPSKKEIAQAFNIYDYKTISDSKVMYISEPHLDDARHLQVGALSKQTIEDGLKAVNLVRFINGLGTVKENKEYTKEAQYAAALLGYIGEGLNHFPDKPIEVPDSFYELGFTGTSESNLHKGVYRVSNLAQSIFEYMEDRGVSNQELVGHRRWLLNKNLHEIGFGFVTSREDNNQNYTATHVVEHKPVMTGYDKDIAWPAPNMPLELFGDSHIWSISLSDKYEAPLKNEVTVKITNMKTNQVFTCSGAQANLWTDNSLMGQGNSISFQPRGITIKDGDIFEAEIKGLEGKANTLRYTVDFFEATKYNLETEVAGATSKGFIVLDTTSYEMSIGNKYQIGLEIKDGAGNKVSKEVIKGLIASGKLSVTDSRAGSVVKLSQLENGNFSVEGKHEGT